VDEQHRLSVRPPRGPDVELICGRHWYRLSRQARLTVLDGGSGYPASVTERPFTYEFDDRRSRLVLHGELDEGACLELRSLLAEETSADTPDLAIDLSDLDFLPSAGVGVLAKAKATRARTGAELTFVAADGTIAQRVLTICGLAHEAG
jgi:anti-anti-sigma factor